MEDPTQAEIDPRRKQRWVRRLAYVLGSFSILGLLTIGALWSIGVMRRDRALGRLRVSGAAVLPPEPEAPTAEGAATLAWLEKFVAARNAQGANFELTEPVVACIDVPALLARQPLEWREKVEELRPCVMATPDEDTALKWYYLKKRALRDLADATPIAQLDACEIAWMNTRGMPLDGSGSEWSEACSLAPLDPLRGQAVDRMAPKGPYILHAQELILDPVLALAVAGDSTQALARVRCGLSMSKLLAHIEGFRLHAAASYHMQAEALATLCWILPYLPKHTDLGDVTQAITTLDDGHELLPALQQDRALGNQFYLDFMSDFQGTRKGFRESRWVRIWQAWDQAAFLDGCERALPWLERPTWEVLADPAFLDMIADIQVRPDHPPYALLASLLLPNFKEDVEVVANHAAYVRMTRLALIAFERGVDAALIEAQSTIDPFNGKPLHARREPDGVVAFWSVGPDLKDQDAPHLRDIDPSTREPYSNLPDLVVRVRLP